MSPDTLLIATRRFLRFNTYCIFLLICICRAASLRHFFIDCQMGCLRRAIRHAPPSRLLIDIRGTAFVSSLISPL